MVVPQAKCLGDIGKYGALAQEKVSVPQSQVVFRRDSSQVPGKLSRTMRALFRHALMNTLRSAAE